MEFAKANYVREWRERRRLFNMLQEMRGNIRVFCRVRPSLSGEKGDCVCTFPMDGVVKVENPRKRREKKWEFDQVFNMQSTTLDVFNEVEPLVTSVMDGYNVCIFAYGQVSAWHT